MNKILCLLLAAVFPAISFATAPITGPGAVCTGLSITLSDATPGGIWSSSTPAVATVSSSGVVNGLTAGTATITYDVSGIYETTIITVNPSPAPITGISSFCNYVYTDTLRCTTPGGIWSDGSPHDSVSTFGVLYHTGPCGGGCGTDTIRYTLSTGCASSFVVTINPLIVSSIYPTMCVGAMGYAGATPSSGTWSTGTPTIAVISPTGTITALSTGTALFTYTLMGCVYPWITTHISNGIDQHQITNVPDTLCNGPDLYIAACGTSTLYNVTTYFGDGTSNNTSFGGAASLHMHHAYDAPGTYSIKQVLFDGTTPKDSFTTSYEYKQCATLPVKLYNDMNSNCLFDAGDSYSHSPASVRIDSNGISIDTISVTSGVYYKAKGPAGTIYAFRLLDLPSGTSVGCPSSGVIYDTITATVNTYPALMFALNCGTSSGFDVSQINSVQCGRHAGYANVIVDNISCNAVSPTLTVNFSPKYAYYIAYPTPTSVSGNTVTWNLSSLMSTSATLPVFRVHYEVPGTWLTPGDTAHSAYSIAPFTGDTNPGDNNTNRQDTVKSSFDPNYIEVNPQGYIPAAASQLKYTIGFENTGNDTARNIYVLDTLSDLLDINSFKMLGASANMNLYINKVGGHNILKFDFPGIDLPDSSHHGFCNGLFAYTIKTIGGFTPGTIIPNRVGIYFDDNEVVMTNTANSIVETVTPLSTGTSFTDRNIGLFPNPATDELTITAPVTLYNSLCITNSIGQVLIEQGFAASQTKVNIAALPPALYYISLKGANGTVVKKFIKQ